MINLLMLSIAMGIFNNIFDNENIMRELHNAEIEFEIEHGFKNDEGVIRFARILTRILLIIIWPKHTIAIIKNLVEK